MKLIGLLTALLALAAVAPVFAGPVIAGFHPGQLYVCDPRVVVIRSIEIDGSDLVAPDTNGRTFSSDVKVLMRHSGGSFSPVRVTRWSNTVLGTELNSSVAPLTSPGSLEFQVIVRGVSSNIASLPLIAAPTNPPLITSVSPSHFAINMTGTRDYLFRVIAKNVGDDTQPFVGSEKAEIGLAFFAEGIVDVWLPNDLRSKSGTYPVKLVGSNGTSNEVSISVGYRGIGSQPNSNAMPTPTPKPFQSHLGPGAQSALMYMNVHMEDLAGHVTLTGTVASIAVKAQLLNAIRSMPGVVDVTDQTTVAPAPLGSPLPHY
jgi:hypothetical protein